MYFIFAGGMTNDHPTERASDDESNKNWFPNSCWIQRLRNKLSFIALVVFLSLISVLLNTTQISQRLDVARLVFMLSITKKNLHDYLSFTMTALSNIWGFYNPSSASPVYIWGPITLSADVLARNGARPSAGTVLTEKTNKHVFFQCSLAFNDFMTRIRNGDVIRSDHGIPRALPVPTWKIHLETSMIHWGRDKMAILQTTFQIHF